MVEEDPAGIDNVANENPEGSGLKDSWRKSLSSKLGKGAPSRTNMYVTIPRPASRGGAIQVRMVLFIMVQGDCTKGDILQQEVHEKDKTHCPSTTEV